jgi:multidrug resistance efflux pump
MEMRELATVRQIVRVGARSAADERDAGHPAPEVRELHSDDLDEIISYVPGRAIRWGTTAIFVAVATLVGASWFIEYPQVITGRVTVTTASPPVRLAAKESGKIARIFVADSQRVQGGTVLAVIESAVGFEDALSLLARLDRLDSSLAAKSRLDWEDPGTLRLGHLQEYYSAFLQSLADYVDFEVNGYNQQKVADLKAQIDKQAHARQAQESQHFLLQEELALEEKQRQRSRQLAASGLLSEMDKEREETEYLRKRQAVENGVGDLADSDLRLMGYKTSLLDLEQRAREEERRLKLALTHKLHELRSMIQIWESSYLFTTPVSGRVTYLRLLGPGQFVASGEPVLAVVPEGEEVVVSMLLTQGGAGRVKVGQRAKIQLDGYPVGEFGKIVGKVDSISLLPAPQQGGTEATYLVRIRLRQGLRTSYGHRLPFWQEMQGSAEIVTEDVRLLERMFYRLRSLLSSRAALK